MLCTFSGWVKVPALHGVRGSHSFTLMSQLPVTMTLTSGQYSTHRIGASCVPTIVSKEQEQHRHTHLAVLHTTESYTPQYFHLADYVPKKQAVKLAHKNIAWLFMASAQHY